MEGRFHYVTVCVQSNFATLNPDATVMLLNDVRGVIFISRRILLLPKDKFIRCGLLHLIDVSFYRGDNISVRDDVADVGWHAVLIFNLGAMRRPDMH